MFGVLNTAIFSPVSRSTTDVTELLAPVPALTSDRSRALLRAYEVGATGRIERTHEIQQVLYARFHLLPEESVPWMRAHWVEFERLDWSPIAVRSLQNLKGDEASAAVVDLVL